MNDSKIFDRMNDENEALHKEFELLAKKSENCEPELLADYARIMCLIYDTINKTGTVTSALNNWFFVVLFQWHQI